MVKLEDRCYKQFVSTHASRILCSEWFLEALHGVLALNGECTYHHSMKPQLGIEAPVGQPFDSIVRAEWVCDTAIIREQRRPPVSSG